MKYSNFKGKLKIFVNIYAIYRQNVNNASKKYITTIINKNNT